MAKAEGFKNKITKAQEDLFKSIESEKLKKKALSEKIVNELSKLEKANVRTLNSLNKEYTEQCNSNKEKLQIFVDTIEQLNSELQTTLEEYDIYCKEHDELAVLKEEQKQQLNVAKNKFKREIQDINIKIDRIEKELKDVLETRAEEFNVELTTYKSKVIEFEKRKRFEVSKIQNNTIKEYDELQKLLLQENKKSEIKSINKKIKQIRLSGLVEEKECVFRHLAEQRQFELDFAKYEYDHKCENSKIEKEYYQKIEDTKFDRAVIEFNFKKYNISSDNEVVHMFNENEKQSKLDHNAKVEDLHKLINERTLEQLSFEQEKADTEAEVTKYIYKSIEENENKQTEKLMENAGKEMALISKDIALLQKNLNMTVTFYVSNIITLYTNYFKNHVLKEETFVNSLLVNNVKGAFLQGNTYDDYLVQIKEIFETFRNAEEEYLESFTSYITMTLNNFIDQIESFVNTIKLLENNINEVSNKYHESIANVLALATSRGVSYAENIRNKAKEEVNAKEYDNKVLFEERTKQSLAEKDEIMKEFEQRELEIKAVRAEQELEFNAEYASLESARDAEKQNIEAKSNGNIDEFTAAYDAKVKGITVRFDEENKSTEKQYKQKIGLL